MLLQEGSPVLGPEMGSCLILRSTYRCRRINWEGVPGEVAVGENSRVRENRSATWPACLEFMVTGLVSGLPLASLPA